MQEIFYERCLFLVLIAGDAEFFGCGLVTGACGLQEQRRFFPLAVLRRDFNPDLRFCFLCPVVRLRKSVRFLPHAIVSASPIEWLPRHRKARHPDVRRKNLHILNPHIADCDPEVRNVLGFGDAAVVVSLFFLEVSLPDLRTTF